MRSPPVCHRFALALTDLTSNGFWIYVRFSTSLGRNLGGFMRALLTVFALASLTSLTLTGCKKETYYDCGDGYSVPLGTVCDGYRDCYNGADEAMCFLHWVCESGELISPLVLCDGTVDCADGSDELFEDEGGLCVREVYDEIGCTAELTLRVEAVCDGFRNRCDGNVDEAYCTNGLTYACDDGVYAVYFDQLCDGVSDCLDHSDEIYCLF